MPVGATNSEDIRPGALVYWAMSAVRFDRTSFVMADRPSAIRNNDLILAIAAERIVKLGRMRSCWREQGILGALYLARGFRGGG